MTTVTVSKKYQIVIPAEFRKGLEIKPGQKLRVIEFQGRLQLIPVVAISESKGIFAGIDTNVPREDDRV